MQIDPPEPTSIIVSGDMPATPMVLVDTPFVRELMDAEQLVAGLQITNSTHQALSGKLLNDLTKAGTKLEQARKAIKEPFLEYGRKIDATAATVQRQIDAVKQQLSGKMRVFQIEQDRLAREAEEKRQAELRRLEQQRQAEERERQRLADEEAARIRAAAPKVQELDLDLPAPAPTAVEQQIAAVHAAPALVAPKPAGARWNVSLKFEVQDVTKLPTEFVIPTANLPKIRGLTAGWREGQPIPVLPGVRFYEDRQFQGTGR